jgi:long-chain acyl-CoA synthetase
LKAKLPKQAKKAAQTSGAPGTLVSRMLEAAAANPDKIAMADSRQSITYAQLVERAGRLAELLDGLTQQPRVGVLLPTCTSFGIAFYGCLMTGRAVIPMSQILKPADLHYALADSGVDTVITSRSISALLNGSVGNRVYIEDVDWNTTGPARPPAAIEPDSPAAILYTAGSDAQPKGVILTHRNLLSNVAGVQAMARLTAQDIYLGVLPMSHAFALLGTLVAPTVTGASSYYLDRFIPSEIGETCVRENITILMAVPSMYNLLLRSHDQGWATKNSLRLCVSGGEVLPRGVEERFADVFCKPLLNGYGMTETSPVISLNVPWNNKPGSVGRPIPGVEVRIVDQAECDVAPTGIGEIVVRGPIVMAGYLNHPQCTAEARTADGFFRTGDLGQIDNDGYLFIRGRKKEIIIISGENVSPAEIEAVLLSHPMVAEAAVIGVANETRGEAPVAFILGRRFHQLTQKDLREYCRERMAAFKIPRRFIVCDKLPRNALGTILKRELHKILSSEETK